MRTHIGIEDRVGCGGVFDGEDGPRTLRGSTSCQGIDWLVATQKVMMRAVARALRACMIFCFRVMCIIVRRSCQLKEYNRKNCVSLILFVKIIFVCNFC